ncbi:hypothetical protein [uncultured Desulfuromonas sp.]|nr:hypothetical protein [uncultured Desulfuromonas sp.]
MLIRFFLVCCIVLSTFSFALAGDTDKGGDTLRLVLLGGQKDQIRPCG